VDNFFNYVSTHPIAAIILGALIILVAYFVIKKLLKFALIVGLILVGVAGYYYYKAPDQFSKDLKSTVDDVRGHAKEALIRGKIILEKGKDLVEDIEKKVKEDKKTVGK
jgi:type III secretory pathway component EscU